MKINTNQKPVLLDGAMGTVLMERLGLTSDEIIDANFQFPDEVVKLHQQYVNAGSQIILTNSLMALTQKDCEQAYSLAKKSKAKKIAASIGPHDKMELAIKTFGRLKVDYFFLETQTDLNKIKVALKAAQKFKIPIMVSMTINKNEKLPSGENPFEIISFLEEQKVTAMGFNCSDGPNELIQPILKLKSQTKIPLIAKPNSGFPNKLDDHQFVSSMKNLVDCGAQFIGGCCGTKPSTIYLLNEFLKDIKKPASNDAGFF